MGRHRLQEEGDRARRPARHRRRRRPVNEQVKGFSVIPRRWVVERSFGWIMMHRRLARDYETKPAHSESMIRLAMISNLAKRATGETSITWHNP
nr:MULTISPECIES: transposase [Streptomyces violaceusniger group]